MNNIFLFKLTSRLLYFSAILTMGMCFFYLSNNSVVFADVTVASSIYQQSPTGINTPTEKSGQPMALPEAGNNSSPGIFSTFFHIILNLGLIITFIFVTVWCLKLLLEKKSNLNHADETKPIKILTSTYLAPRKTIHLVEIGNRVLVLGVGNDEINKLDVITDPAEIEIIRQSTQVGFSNILERLIYREASEKTRVETKKMAAENNVTTSDYAEKIKRITRKRKEQNDLPEDQA